MHGHKYDPTAEAMKKLSNRKKLFAFQVVSLVVVGLGFLGTFAVNAFWPGYFTYPYLTIPFEVTNLFRFWPLLVWLVVILFLEAIDGRWIKPTTGVDGDLLVWGLITGNLAALWEELGYRFVFICYAMLSLSVANWLYGSGLMWLVVAFLALVAVVTLVGGDGLRWVAILPAGLAALLYQAIGLVDPVFWFYEVIVMPVLNYVSFGSFTEIMTSGQYQHLFIMGGITTNAWFRDGHKYQGLFGILDAWLMGFVLLYAALTYGLLTAVVLHGLWNTLVHTSEYLRRRLSAR